MGLFQKAVETYDNMESIAGREFNQEGKRATLAPVGFISTGVDIVITLSKDGRFEKAEEIFDIVLDNKGKEKRLEKKIIIPATEGSAGRCALSAKTTPHPMCDKYMFMDPEKQDSYSAYVAQLDEWCQSDFSVPQIKAVLNYVKGGTIRNDLSSINGITDDTFVCWKVRSTEVENEELWKNKSVIDSYVNYCKLKVDEKSKKGLCYIYGETLPMATQHLKGVVSISGNAKLISANDTTNFTYRGRFKDDEEALSISYIASQKAHNALKWIVSNDGVRIGDRTLICWNPKGKQLPKPTRSLFSKNTDNNKRITPTNYREALAKAVNGYKSNLDITDETVIAIFEAATTGRLSVSYYSEQKAEDFLERLRFWDETSSWEHPFFGVSSPDLRSIVDVAYGTLRDNNNIQSYDVDDSIIANIMARLLLCRLEKKPFPYDIMRNAVQKSSALMVYSEDSKNNRIKQLYTTCAIIKKYYYDHFKEELLMALEPEKKDRSYQFGRLLAVMEKAEKDTYESSERRESNAIRMQPVFVKRPLHTSKIVLEQLKNAYFPRLSVGSRSFYDKLIGEIMAQISETPDCDINKPLDEKYLIGYYLQKNALYTKKNENNDNMSEVNEQ